MTFPIDKHISISNAPRKSKYPFMAMEVGDSFAIQNPTPKDIEKLRTSASYFGRRTGRMYRTRMMADNSIRCWRVEDPIKKKKK